jgi:cell division transport system permease protein
MKSLRSHLSLTVALFAILFTVQIFALVLRLVDSYENKLKESYAMVLTSHAQLEEAMLDSSIKGKFQLTVLSNDEILEELSSDLDKKQITLLKATLPYFYELKLDHFPQPAEINKMESKLLNVPGVKEIESFANRHDQVFKLLLLIKSIVDAFAVIIIIISILVILKEMRLWQLNHQDRMHIMALFGAPVWLRSAVLFRFAVLDTIFSTVLVVTIFMLLENSQAVQELFSSIGVTVSLINPLPEAFILFAIAFVSSMTLAFTLVLKKV